MAETGAGSAAAGEAPRWTLMTRLDCPLCTSFETALRAWEAGHGRFELAVVDVDSSPTLAERYGLRVPLLLSGEQEICAFRFRAERAAAALAAC
ncbi:MAG: glutaredoxin family protein [Proteobacteria bacterium]|nr:glutaredoxin family protein [Pseudomonadota bacterium]